MILCQLKRKYTVKVVVLIYLLNNISLIKKERIKLKYFNESIPGCHY